MKSLRDGNLGRIITLLILLIPLFTVIFNGNVKMKDNLGLLISVVSYGALILIMSNRNVYPFDYDKTIDTDEEL